MVHGGTYRTGLSIYTGSEANYLVKLRDSYIGHSEATAISVVSLPTKADPSQQIHISNCIIDNCVVGIDIEYHNSPTQIVIENCIIMNISDTYGCGLKIVNVGDDIEHPQFSVILSNISFENNKLPQIGGIQLHNVKAILN